MHKIGDTCRYRPDRNIISSSLPSFIINKEFNLSLKNYEIIIVDRKILNYTNWVYGIFKKNIKGIISNHSYVFHCEQLDLADRSLYISTHPKNTFGELVK